MKKLHIILIAFLIYNVSCITSINDLPSELDYGTGSASKSVLDDKDIVIFFFGASWWGGCQEFVPIFTKVYKEAKE